MNDQANPNNLKSKSNQKEDELIDKNEDLSARDINQTKRQAKKNKLFSKKKSVVILIFILVAGLVFFFVQNWQKIVSKFGQSFSNSAYSENQQRVIDNFGLPQTFTLTRADNQILEIWKYIYLDEMFIFQDGEFIVRQHFNFDLEPEAGIYLNLEPKVFYSVISLEQLNDLLEREPSFEAEIDERLDADKQYFVSYDDLLNVTLVDGKIIGLQTVAFKTMAEVEKANSTTIDQKQIERPGKIYIANSKDSSNSFSYYLNDPVFRLVKQRPLHLDDEHPSYGYCYSLDQGLSFNTEPQNPGACADEESMVWLINLYPLDVYENLNELEMMGMEELTRNDEFVYTITHTNGDLPVGLPNWTEILKDIKDDFSVPMAEDLMLNVGVGSN